MKDIDFQEFLQRSQKLHEERYDALEEQYKTNSKEFTIESFELKSLDEWTAEHGKVCRKRAYSYKFNPTGIGVALTVECDCGANQNITDYESW